MVTKRSKTTDQTTLNYEVSKWGDTIRNWFLVGIEVTQKIKSDMPNLPIIGLSLHDSEEVIQDMQNAGASGYLTKYEAFETLCVTIWDEVSASKITNQKVVGNLQRS